MTERKHFLDWLRVIAFGLLILFHTGMLYVSWDYTLKSPRIFPNLEWAMLALSPWRMALLFLISGVASRFLLGKLGPGGFALDRVRRIIPVLLVGMFVVIPPQTYVMLLDRGLVTTGYWRFWGEQYLAADQTLVAQLGQTMPTWDHLWFLVYLFVYLIGFAGLAAMFRGFGASQHRRSILPLGACLVLPAAWMCVTNFLIEELFPVTHAFIGDWGAHLKWAGLFGFGTMIAMRSDVWAWVEANRRKMLALAVLFLLAQSVDHVFWLAGTQDPRWDGAFWSIATSLYAWCAILALSGYAARYLDRASAMLRYLNQAILPVYVLHQPVLLVSAYLVFPLDMPVIVEAGVLVALTFAVSLAIYEILIRRLAFMRFLFGLKSGSVRGIAATATVFIAGMIIFASPARAQSTDYHPPRLADGRPDLQGVWTNASVTKLERVAPFRDLIIPDSIAASVAPMYTAYLRDGAAPSDPDAPEPKLGGNIGGYNTFWLEPGEVFGRIGREYRSSWIVEPADGRLPYSEEGRTVHDQALRDIRETFGDPEARPVGERCLIGYGSTAGPPMLNVDYNNFYRIVQAPGYVVIEVEMNHDARIVRMTGEHSSNQPAKWMGDSIGWWDGDTLVVETTGMHPGESLRTTFSQTLYVSPNAKIVERFTRVADDQILYAFTVDDRAIYEQPWRGEMPLRAGNGNLYEYACHEGNTGLPGILAGARREERG